MAHHFLVPFLLFALYSSHFVYSVNDFTSTSESTDSELEMYEKYLEDELKRVGEALSARKKRAVVSPISSSLPNRESAYFLNRIGALKKSLLLAKNETSESHDPPRIKVDYQAQAINDTLQECKRLSQPELVAELKQKGTYNPDLMAWDALGVIRFLDRTLQDQYQRESPSKKQRVEEVVQRNVEALAHLLKELNVSCDVSTPTARAKLQNITFSEPRRSIISPSLRRSKREDNLSSFLNSIKREGRAKDSPLFDEDNISPRQKLIGESHIVPFGCDKRGAEEDGYLRLCGACQSIRRLPDTFFPPFINEVTCDTDKACLYFYDYPHGKCRQKHMNFVVLRNIGTKECQIWKKFNLNVRVSCECFMKCRFSPSMCSGISVLRSSPQGSPYSSQLAFAIPSLSTLQPPPYRCQQSHF